jgi:hypothetical protein
METETLHCYSCGGSFAREELQYRPIWKGAYRKWHITALCAMKSKKERTIKAAKSSFRNSTFQTSNFQLRQRGINLE